MRGKSKNIETGNDLLIREEDFSILFREWHVGLVYFVLRFVKDQLVAEDIAEDAFVVLWEKRAHFSNIKVAKAYLYSTAKNASINFLRSEKNNQKKINGLHAVSDTREGFVLEELVRAEFVSELHSELNGLPEQCRKIFNMLFLEGKNNKEVAEAMNLSIHTVKAQRQRGLSILRKKLAGFFSLFFGCI
jgi:RNA polymerase sigma-70 factor (family 1)